MFVNSDFEGDSLGIFNKSDKNNFGMKSVLFCVFMWICCIFCGSVSNAQDIGEKGIIPRPLIQTSGEGFFYLRKNTEICTSPEGKQVALQLAELLRKSTGYRLPVKEGVTEKKNTICLSICTELDTLGREGYRLQIAPEKVSFTALDKAGLFYAMQTFRQLLPVSIEKNAVVKDVVWKVACTEIVDKPQYSWRGYMQDVSRTFYSVEVIKKYLDVMALYKLNVLHFHLTDDQGWRIEIHKYPKLTSPLTTRFAEKHKEPEERNGFYTQQQIKELVEYAAERHITIVPEIDIPGHSWPTLLVYPELGVNDKHYPEYVFPFLASWGYWGNQFTPNTLDPTKEVVYSFLDDVFEEIAALFPAEYIHFGGDEVRHIVWDKEPHITAFKKEHGMQNSLDLQNYFVGRVCQIIKSKGKKPIGWNDILENPEGLTRETAIMSWVGEEAIVEAAERGFYTVATPTDYLYFDITQADRNDGTMSDLAYRNINSLERIYNYDPAHGLKPEQKKYLLGVQANMWTAVPQEVKDMNVQNFPRLLAVAEIGWTSGKQKDFTAFEQRLQQHYGRLDQLKIDYYRPGGYITGHWHPEILSLAYQPLTWDVSTKVYTNGRIIAGFFYTHGENYMNIRKVELLENGKVISTDEHQGLADTFRGTNKTKTFLYHLQVDHYNPDAVYTLRAEVKGQGGTDSYGNFTFNQSPFRPFMEIEPHVEK